MSPVSEVGHLTYAHTAGSVEPLLIGLLRLVLVSQGTFCLYGPGREFTHGDPGGRAYRYSTQPDSLVPCSCVSAQR